MATLNTNNSGHGSRTETYGDGTSIDFNTFPAPPLLNAAGTEGVERAMKILDRMAAKESSSGQCNKYFRGLGNNDDFSTLWKRDDVFVNYSPSLETGFYAACHNNNRDLTLTRWCINTQNCWMIAATLCHELAHAAGAPGGDSHNAEKAAKKCYFGPQYNPAIVGSLQDLYGKIRAQTV